MAKKTPKDLEILDLDQEDTDSETAEQDSPAEVSFPSPDTEDASRQSLPNEKPAAAGMENIDTAQDGEEEGSASKRKFWLNPNFLIALVILLVFSIAAFKLLKWNQGETLIIDPNEDTSEFDVETEDFIMQLDARYLEGRTDDGITTILCLGNGPFSSDRGKNGTAAQLAEFTGATVYNCAFSNTTLSSKNTVYDPAYPNDAFSLYWLTKSMTLQDYHLLDDTLASFAEQDSQAAQTLNTLKKIDMEAVDIITIMYDGTDYLEDRIITSPYDLNDIGTCSGALKQSLTLLREAYPHIRIIVMSPAFACLVDQNGEYQPGSSTAQRNGFLSDYMIAAKNIAVDAGVTFIDNYNGTITEGNYTQYLKDNILLNSAGCKLVAERLSQVIQ